MIVDDEEEWGRVKMGRFNDADGRIIEGIMGKRFRLAYSSPHVVNPKGKERQKSTYEKRDESLPNRASVIEKGYSYATGKEVVIKVRSRPKSDRGVVTLMRYVARLRPEDEREGGDGAVSLWDGFGTLLSVGDIHAIHERWELVAALDNLSPKARRYLKLGDLEALRTMDGRERLQYIQAWHFVFSIEEDGTGEGVECKFRSAVRATIDGAFTAKGHRVVWGIHRGHTDHLHAHAVVRALSDFGGRLHSDIHGDYLHALRLSFAENLRRTGLEYRASRRVDRRLVRERILAGHEPLHGDSAPWREAGGGGS